MTDEELIEAAAAEVSCHLCWTATIAVGNSDDCGDFPEMPAYVQEIYRDAARAVIPVAQAPLLARITELVAALQEIAAEAYVPLNELPNHDQPNGWRTLACARIDIARNTLRSTQ